MQLVDFAMCEAYVFMLSMKKTIVRALTRIAILEWDEHKPLGLEAEAGGLCNPLSRWLYGYRCNRPAHALCSINIAVYRHQRHNSYQKLAITAQTLLPKAVDK
ncbi:hypothetical protein SAMN05216308_101537 [Nitrosospira sp. Nsp13]|jgi:hypothetical protein|nr:hypothetical protein SAMN05216308_101537 [Nitrosospira sp. Nsp13]